MAGYALRDKGFEAIKEAVALDKAGSTPEAIEKYMHGLDYLMTHLKHEKNEKAKQMIENKMQQYLARVELLKESRTPKVAQPGGAAQLKKPKPGDDEGGGASTEDVEKDKMRKQLMDAVKIEDSGRNFDSVAGLEIAKLALQEAAIKPTLYPQLFAGKGRESKRKPWKGILMYGPPGTGKSYLAGALAGEAKSTFFSVSSSDLVSKWVGDSPKLVRTLFEIARERKPAIVFVDEIDSLCTARGDGESESARQIKTEFLVQMDGVGNDQTGVLTIGATNLPWAIDQAVRRRMQKRIYIPLPDERTRAVLFKVQLQKHENKTLTDGDYAELAQLTDGFSGSDISIVIGEALMDPIRMMDSATHFKQVTAKNAVGEDTPGMWQMCSPGAGGAIRMDLAQIEPHLLADPPLDMMNFLAVIHDARPSVSAEDLGPFEQWTEEFGQDGSGASGQRGDDPSLQRTSTAAAAAAPPPAAAVEEGTAPAEPGRAGSGAAALAHAMAHLTQALPATQRVVELEQRVAALEAELRMMRGGGGGGGR